MKQYCFIHCFGKGRVPEKGKWKNNVSGGINRLYYIIGGEGGYIRSGEKSRFKKGYMYFLPSYNSIPTWSSYETPESVLDHLYVGVEFLPPIITDQVIEIHPKDDPIIEAALDVWMKIAEKHRGIKGIDEDSLEYLKSTVAYIINKIIARNDIKTLTDKTILSALEEIHRNISKPISVDMIAQNANMSYDGFIKKFKSNLRTTPYQYIKELKIRTALTLLDEGATLEEAALRCGYSEASALLHAFSTSSFVNKVIKRV